MLANIEFRNDNPATIWNRLAAKLGRKPTHEEAKAEVRRILQSVTIDLAGKGGLPHQRGKIK